MEPLDGTEVVVVGGGIGGLSAGCYLAEAGASVRVVEKNEQLGGRASVLERDGFRFDMGPSWYLMPDVFERFFGHFDRTPSDFYELTRLDPHYRVYFKDGDCVDVTGDREEMAAVFDSYETGAGEALERYLERAEYTYEVGMDHFVYADRTRIRDFLSLDVARHARGLSLLGSMDGHVADYFEHPKLRQLVQYSLVFLGGSPANTPALYNLMSHVDFNLGVWYPDGGIGAVVDALVTLGESLGVSYETGRPVVAIDGEPGAFDIETIDGRVSADLVVSNAGYPHTELALLGPERREYDAAYWESRTYAPSAFLWYLGIEGEVPELAHHTLVLPREWDDHFREIFDEPEWPTEPAYYVCVPSQTDETVAPDGHSALFVLVPIAPGLDDGAAVREAFGRRLLADLDRHTGTQLTDRIVVEEIFCVSEFVTRYNSFQGTALGLAHTLRQTAPFRPRQRAGDGDGFYYVGADTTPGIGVPMCLISGEHVAAKVIDDYGDGCVGSEA